MVYYSNNGQLEEIPLSAFLDHILDTSAVIALVGAGGKTTLLYALADRAAASGRRALATTTTHIWKPKDGSFCRTWSECEDHWSAGRRAVRGEERGTGKLGPLDPADFRKSLAADCLLVEADGAKGLPCKVPAAHEPVIPAEAGLVVALAGLSALGKPLGEVCFRSELAAGLLGCGMDHRLTPADLAVLLLSPQGGRKSVGTRAFLPLLTQMSRAPDGARAVLLELARSDCPGAAVEFRDVPF